MQVKLIAITPNAEQLIAYCARVSNPTNQSNEATAEKLLKYLAKHHHWSPFEMANAVLEIKATRDVTRQIIRHRSFSFQEFSQRYAKVTELEDREPRLQDATNRQNSLPVDNYAIKLEWENVQHRVKAVTKWCYEHVLDLGIAREVARSLLPEGLTPSTLYMNGTIRSWIHYWQVRDAEGVQKEHREVAALCREIICKELPVLASI